MNPVATALLVGTVLLAAPSRSAASARPGRLVTTLEAEASINLLDGTEDAGCRAPLIAAADGKGRAWISFGTVAANAADVNSNWRAVSPRSDCGGGAWAEAKAPGRPYLVLDLESKPARVTGEKTGATVTLHMRRFSGFDSSGRASYQVLGDRTAVISGDTDALLPLLLPDSSERQAFGIHDAWVRLRARSAKAPAAYGAISIEGDVPGAEILIDGGPVGRVSERAPVTLSHVPVGEREVRLRDASGREARQGVAVKTGRTIPIRLEILGSAADAPDQGLRAIGRNPQGYEEYWRDKDKAVVVQVPAGEFVMGSLEGQGEPTERPQHRVFVSDFLIDKLEVTWRQLRRHAEATGTPLPPAPAWGPEESYAASNVQWNEAQAYCAWVGGRLPTEAEWEKAARGTDGRLYSWGERWDPDHCNAWEGGPHRPRSVGSFAKCVSPYGVLEMPGGVWEWCADWYAEGYDAAAASHDPVGPSTGSMRVLRGGSWLNQGLWTRPAYRHRNDPTSRNVHHGFRCVQKAPA